MYYDETMALQQHFPYLVQPSAPFPFESALYGLY